MFQPVRRQLLVVLLRLLLSTDVARAKEYCLDEMVDIQCNSDEILIVESAQYGRMQLGRCVKMDYGYIGCGSDVTDILAGKCSGRRHCRIFNLEVLFSGSKVCPEDLKPYLEANFRCAKIVLPAQTTACLHGGHLSVRSSATSVSGLIASSTSYELGVGDSLCPWLIEAGSGQRINLTLMDFSDYGGSTVQLGSAEMSSSRLFPDRDHQRASSSSSACRELAVVEEMTTMKNLVTCKNQTRTTVVYSSKTNVILIKLNTRSSADDDVRNTPHFVIRYDVYGCIHPTVIPLNSYFMINANNFDSIRVQCNHTDESWILRCQDGSWKGHIGNCTIVPMAETSETESLSYGISLLLIVAVAASICFIFLASGLLCLYRSRRRLPTGTGSKHHFVMTLSTCASNTNGTETMKSNTVPRSSQQQQDGQGHGRPIYWPLETNASTLRPISNHCTDCETPLFHQTSTQTRRLLPVSAPLLTSGLSSSGGVAAELRSFPPLPLCTCPVSGCEGNRPYDEERESAWRNSAEGGGGGGSRGNMTEVSTDDPPPPPPPPFIPFTTFKPLTPENEYGTPHRRVIDYRLTDGIPASPQRFRCSQLGCGTAVESTFDHQRIIRGPVSPQMVRCPASPQRVVVVARCSDSPQRAGARWPNSPQRAAAARSSNSPQRAIMPMSSVSPSQKGRKDCSSSPQRGCTGPGPLQEIVRDGLADMRCPIDCRMSNIELEGTITV